MILKMLVEHEYASKLEVFTMYQILKGNCASYLQGCAQSSICPGPNVRHELDPSEGFPRNGLSRPLGAVGTGVGRFREFLAFRRPATGLGPGPMEPKSDEIH